MISNFEGCFRSFLHWNRNPLEWIHTQLILTCGQVSNSFVGVGLMKEIQINQCRPECEAHLDYRSSKERNALQNEVVSIASDMLGNYRVEGRGKSLAVGDELYFTLKGSQDLVHRLAVVELRYFIEPPEQWQATLQGEAFDELKIYTWQVNCNKCSEQYSFEFVCQSEDDSHTQASHAGTRLKALGWSVEGSRHVCVDCTRRKN
jgi:hypothetical protein